MSPVEVGSWTGLGHVGLVGTHICAARPLVAPERAGGGPPGGFPARLPVPPRSDGPLLQFLSSNLTFQMTRKMFIKVEK